MSTQTTAAAVQPTDTTPVLWQLELADDSGTPVQDRALAVAYLAALAEQAGGAPGGLPAVAAATYADPDCAEWGVWVAPLYGAHAEAAQAALCEDPADEATYAPDAAWYVQLPGTDGGVWIVVSLP